MAKIYVGNLPFDATEQTIQELFSRHGTVESVAVITDRDTGRSRGFAFVEMSDQDAKNAIRSLDGSPMDGRNLKVNEARPRGDRSSGRRDRW